MLAGGFLVHNKAQKINLLGDPVWTRTKDRQIRNLLLYPTELRDPQKKRGSTKNTEHLVPFCALYTT